jgi:hypothetical protein
VQTHGCACVCVCIRGRVADVMCKITELCVIAVVQT